jgi:membrane protease YdiL (CAAX protease family)
MHPTPPTISPSPRRATIDLDPGRERDVPVWLVLLTFVSIESMWDAFAWTFLGPSAVKWTATRIPSQALIQGIPQNVVAIGLTIGAAWSLGWWRGLGLGRPRIASSVAYVILVPSGVLAAVAGWRAAEIGVEVSLMLAMLIYYVVQPAGEEILYRGFLLHGLTRRLGTFWAFVGSSALFALAHSIPWGWPPTPFSFAMLFGFGVVACTLRIETGSIWYPIAFHALYNFMSAPYGWVDGPAREYLFISSWRRVLGVAGSGTALLWFAGIVVAAVWGTGSWRGDRTRSEPGDHAISTRPRMPKS